MDNGKEIWNLFELAVKCKSPMQFNLYSLYKAVEEVKEDTLEDIEDNSLTL